MKVKIKKLTEEATLPTYSHASDAAMDLTATTMNNYPDYTEYGTGLSISIPENHVGLLFPRSSVSNKDLALSNSVGVIDSGYLGEVKIRFRRTKDYNGNLRAYNAGERIAQLLIIPRPTIEWDVVQDLGTTERNTGGFGSTDTPKTVASPKTMLGEYVVKGK
jgi:dUTP pyrophosphatase